MTSHRTILSPKKLIEVALPLDAINSESLRRKQKAPKGWPSSFHKWWAQRPLAAARAIIFAQLVNDPSWKWEIENEGQAPPANLKASWASSRKRLFTLLERLVEWDNSLDANLLASARAEIQKSWEETCSLNKDHPDASLLFDPAKPPAIHDPFAGSGTIPLEAQRLGITAIATDLNPVAVLINKALMAIPRRFEGTAPIGPISSKNNSGGTLLCNWPRATGLAEDVRRYGEWLTSAARARIGALYPNVRDARGEHQPIAWIWARTVKSPSPAFRHVDVPLTATFTLSSKAGRGVYLKPVINGDSYEFEIKKGETPATLRNGTKLNGANFRCILSDAPIDAVYIRSEAQAGRIGARLLAVVADGPSGREYFPACSEQVEAARSAQPTWVPDLEFFPQALGFRIGNYGMRTWGDLYTPRQLTALTTFCDLIGEVQRKVKEDAERAGMSQDDRSLEQGGTGAQAYAEAIVTYLACAIDRMAYYGSHLTTWLPKDNALRDCMPRQALAMTWDFAEANPFAKSSGDYSSCLKSVANYLDVAAPFADVIVAQEAAQSISKHHENVIFCTDPPYFDNIGYADLSDYFYVWLRKNVQHIFPTIFSSLATPKAEELVATPARHGGKSEAEQFFLSGVTKVMANIASLAHPAFPTTIYYAFKQSETVEDEGTSSSGWETFLQGALDAGLSITGTWPVRTEGAGRMRASESNALASSIVLVCRLKSPEADTISRRRFIRELNETLPAALEGMTRAGTSGASGIAPVDLSQAMIGPGMAVFSKYKAVLEADGSPMTVKSALRAINRFLADDDFDADTQFCLHWFEQHGWTEGVFGEADQLARAKGTAVNGVQAAGVIEAAGGKVKLLRWADYPTDWHPKGDARLPVWEVLHHLIRLFKARGESAAGEVLSATSSKADAARQLAYRLYTLCERAGWAEDARAYNEIITSWAAIEDAAVTSSPQRQTTLFDA